MVLVKINALLEQLANILYNMLKYFMENVQRKGEGTWQNKLV